LNCIVIHRRFMDEHPLRLRGEDIDSSQTMKLRACIQPRLFSLLLFFTTRAITYGTTLPR
jgi:hypothetical protein